MTATILQFPPRAPLARTVTLLRLDGRPLATRSFLPGPANAPWAWIAATVAAWVECSEEEVSVAEGIEGDVVTAEGFPVCLVAF